MRCKMYQITLNEKQLETLIDACELLSRIKNNQIFGAVERLPLKSNVSDFDLQKELQGIIDPLIDEDKKDKEAANIAYDLKKVFLHQLSWDKHPEGGVTVKFDEPIKSSKEPFAIIKKLK